MIYDKDLSRPVLEWHCSNVHVSTVRQVSVDPSRSHSLTINFPYLRFLHFDWVCFHISRPSIIKQAKLAFETGSWGLLRNPFAHLLWNLLYNHVVKFPRFSMSVSFPIHFVILNAAQIDSPMCLTLLSSKEVYNNIGTMSEEYLHHATWDVLITTEQCYL